MASAWPLRAALAYHAHALTASCPPVQSVSDRGMTSAAVRSERPEPRAAARRAQCGGVCLRDTRAVRVAHGQVELRLRVPRLGRLPIPDEAHTVRSANAQTQPNQLGDSINNTTQKPIDESVRPPADRERRHCVRQQCEVGGRRREAGRTSWRQLAYRMRRPLRVRSRRQC